MSGGHFNYIQHNIDDASIEVLKWAENWRCTSDPKTIERMIEAAKVLERAGRMLTRVDYLISGDDGEKSFNRRWEEEMLD